MFKIYLSIILLFLLSNCTAPTASLFGPLMTGAKTGSIYQASISYGSNKIFNDLKESYNKKSNQIGKNIAVLESSVIEIPKILSTSAIAKVEFSDTIEPEPLP
jgi:hypothetical protein